MQTLSDYDFDLPQELIAQQPAEERGASRLLEVGIGRPLKDWHFRDLPGLIQPGDVLVLNDSAVLKARLRARKPSGGAVEILIERVIGERRALSLIGTRRKLVPGQNLEILGTAIVRPIAPHEVSIGVCAQQIGLGHGADLREPSECVARARVIQSEAPLTLLEFDCAVMRLMEIAGSVPLPPYIRPDPVRDDADRYRTVYQRTPGSVAAPTAGLHFDEAMLQMLHAAGVRIARLTLHVGAGTFLPVRHQDLDRHAMHPERFELDTSCAASIAEARAAGKRIIAVGTTTLRTLESCADPDRLGYVRSQDGETRLFIRPGYQFRVCDALLTNFHLPRSTLLMLVSAFAGYATIRAAYAHAIAQRYRFFSYGDACLLHRDGSAH